MIIKRITVGNYKNIETTTIDLKKMVALVSINNYGKTNLLEAIRFGFDFISASAKQRNSMMRWIRGIPLTPALAGKEYLFQIELEDNSLGDYKYVRYSYNFSWFNDQNSGAVIVDENIETRPNESVRYTAYLKRQKGLYRAGKNVTGFRKISLAKNILAIDVLAAIEGIEIGSVVTKIKQLSYKMCNALELNKSFTPSPIEFNFEKLELDYLDNDIPRALSILSKESPEKFDVFVETVKDLFPEFEDISLQYYALSNEEKTRYESIVSSEGDDQTELHELPYRIKDEIYRLVIKSKYINQDISMEHMSTGTQRIMWLIVNAIFGSSYGINLLGVDEVETSIHPKMIRGLLESLNEILDTSSMIVTSHSPYLIQYLKPEVIYIGVPNEDGVARFKRIKRNKIKGIIDTVRALETSVGEYLFELMAGDEDSVEILKAYLEE